MAKYNYTLLDVFTDRAFGGNQLAVFSDGSGLSDTQMQSLAKELNLAETTFVFPPQQETNDFQVRIFTPVLEMPMAGHPTIGTAFVLARQGLVASHEETEVVTRFEEKVGVIPVKIKFENGLPVFCQMAQPLPEFGPVINEPDTIASMLGLSPENLVPGQPPEVVSCGVPYLIVPVKSLADIERIQLQSSLLHTLQATMGQANVYVFTAQAVTAKARYHSRMFWLEGGIMSEDSATGSASGPLGCYLAKHGLLGNDHTCSFVNEQGFEMERPSFIHVEIDQATPGQVSGVRVGGQAYFMGGGFFELT